MYIEQADIPLAAFNAANISAMKPADMSEGVLAEARPLPKHPKSEAEGLQFRTGFFMCHRNDTRILDDYAATDYE